ncbi:MBOAT family O-acyltransferase [Butyrivibrio sp. AD3002]|uniref:MBOAT family O-acyltransferase n=1 Tax=Butyrivibrio sp. AD3002 TaxID=1280670 RepID=UPI00047E3614|nr:MBOAT family O-acyltransferase [Butyrivibrio sp. AD3002]
MSFNSFSFILIFLPVVLIIWYGLNYFEKRKLADLSLIAASLILYGIFSTNFVIILLISCIGTFGITKLMIKYEGASKAFLATGIIGNLLLLGYFKYTNFFLTNIFAVLGKELSELKIILPIGISFYVFSQIAFLIDLYRYSKGTDNRESFDMESVSLSEYILYITYFPKIIQGPIALPGEMISQFRSAEKRKPSAKNFRKGIELFTIGLSKKVLLGDNLSKIADYGFQYTYYMDTLTGLLVLISYSLQLYFDFSGYCDMAEGVSMMLGIELPRNFNSPYKAISVRNLWQRWHMTLTRFFVRYVYIPLGGSKKGKLRTALNVLIVFVLSGFWHGAGWTYICWGLVMGIMVVFDDLGIIATKGDIKKHYLLREKPMFIIPQKIGQILTYIIFLVSLVFFRSQNMTYALQYFKQLFIPTWPGFMYKTSAVLDIPENYLATTATNLCAKNMTNMVYLVSWIILLIISFIVIRSKNAKEIVDSGATSKRFTAFLVILFVWSFISLSQVSTFIYFQF